MMQREDERSTMVILGLIHFFLLMMTEGYASIINAIDDVSLLSASQHHRHFYYKQTALQYTYDEPTTALKENDSSVHKTSFSRSLDYLDLHGVSSSKHARSVFLDHMKRALESGINVVTVVTGRGRHAESGKPVGVLAEALPKWINSDEFLHKKVKHCTMKSLGGCYTLILREEDDLTWLPTEEYYRVREAARTKSPLHQGCLKHKKYKRMATYHAGSLKSDSILSEVITHNGKRWLREGGKIALARCLDLPVKTQTRRTPCLLCEETSGRFLQNKDQKCPHVLRCSGKGSKLTRVGHENNKKKLKQSKQSVKSEKAADIKNDKLSTKSSSQLPVSLSAENHAYPKDSTAFMSKKNIPCYRVIKKEGPDHAPTFTVEVILEGRKAYGSGASLKKAKVQSLSNLKK